MIGALWNPATCNPPTFEGRVFNESLRLLPGGAPLGYGKMDHKTIQKIKKDHQDNILDELRREKAAVLARAGWDVEEVIEKLKGLDRKIQLKLSSLKSTKDKNESGDWVSRRKLICEEINCIINEFNTVRKKAELKYYYLIVTREALGLRRHEMVQKLYKIPEKKKKYELNNG